MSHLRDNKQKYVLGAYLDREDQDQSLCFIIIGPLLPFTESLGTVEVHTLHAG